jgi:hypothetical protein
LDNISLPVNSQANLYQSVLKAWTNALVMVESLVSGMPQSVLDRAVLLALSAWHLHPYMLVLGSSTARVDQSDELVGPGGILTHWPSPEERRRYWNILATTPGPHATLRRCTSCL